MLLRLLLPRTPSIRSVSSATAEADLRHLKISFFSTEALWLGLYTTRSDHLVLNLDALYGT